MIPQVLANAGQVLQHADADLEDTTIETIYFYMITEDGRLRIDKDRHCSLPTHG